jgi:hypothetical protein
MSEELLSFSIGAIGTEPGLKNKYVFFFAKTLGKFTVVIEEAVIEESALYP